MCEAVIIEDWEENHIANIVQQLDEAYRQEHKLSYRDRSIARVIRRLDATSKMLKNQRHMPRVVINLQLAVLTHALSDLAIALECDS